MADFTEAIRLDAEDGEAYFHRALVYARKNEMDKAAADYKEVFRLEPKPVEDTRSGARPRTAKSRGELVDQLEAAMEKFRDEAGRPLRQGARLAKGRKLDKAIAEYDAAVVACIRAAPKSISTAAWPTGRRANWKTRWHGLHPGHRPRSAVHRPLTATAASPSSNSTMLAAAKADFDKVLELDPKDATAQKNLELILKLQKGEANMTCWWNRCGAAMLGITLLAGCGPGEP